MPDWVESELRKLVSFQKGRKAEVSDYPRDQFAPYLGAGVLAGGEITEFADTRGAVLADQNDTLMLWDGERSGLVGSGQIGVVSSTVSKLTPKGWVTPKFLYYSLAAQFPYIQNRRTGTGVPHVPKDLGRILKIRFPECEDQQHHIAEILATVDEAIEHTEALIAKTQQIKAGLMHDLFTRGVTPDGQLRPPREEAPQLYKESPLGWIPKEWGYQPISKLTHSIIDGTHFTPTYVEHGVPFLRVTDIQSEDVAIDSVKYVTLDEHQALTRRCAPRRGDILLSKNGTIGIARVVDWDWEFSIFVSLCLIRVTSDLNNKYLTSLFSTDIVWSQIRRRAKQGTVTNLHLEEIRNLLIPLPEPGEQSCIVERLASLIERLSTMQAELRKLASLKAGLMHDLLTGRVRVATETSAKPAPATANV